ncbi:MAG TPA: glycosyltransferase family 4 protein, partial [Planctomycetota bacterium]|nr:glycosyltransferase family 4 protein [Planctomycetota bacterium]
ARDGFLDMLVRTAEEIVTTILALDHEWEHIVANAIFLCGFAGLLAITVKLIRYRSQHVSRLDASLRAGRRGKWFARITFPFRELARQYAHFGAIEEAMLRAVESIEPDIVHCHDLSSLPAGVKHKRRSSCVLVYDSHEIFEEAAGLTRFQRKFYRIQQRRYTPHVDHFITINESIGDFLTKRYPKLPDPVIVMNACLPALERPEYDGRLHDAAGLERSARILLYQGGFSPHRGLPQLVRAASLLPEEWTLVMMGWGRLEPKLREIATSVDPEGKRVRFIPGAPQSELVLWTQGAAAGVIPYENVCLNHWFCTPNKLWEYPNAGVPILASPFPELERVVVGEGVGWLLGDPITPEGIAAAVARIDDDELAAKRSACRRFIARSNWRIFETRLVDLYRSAARQRNSVPAVA